MTEHSFKDRLLQRANQQHETVLWAESDVIRGLCSRRYNVHRRAPLYRPVRGSNDSRRPSDGQTTTGIGI